MSATASTAPLKIGTKIDMQIMDRRNLFAVQKVTRFLRRVPHT
jgi:hypothetical protein